MSQFSVKATFDGKELVQGFKDVKKEVQGLESAGEDAKKSLDEMLQQKNSTTNYKRQLSQITAELNDLAVNYARLSEAEKQSEFGQAMSQRIDELTAKAQELKGVFADVNESLSGATPDVKVWDGMSELIEAAASGFQTYAGMLGMSEEKQEALTKTIAKMATIQAGANTVVKIGKMLQKDSNIIMAVTKVQTMAATAAIRLKTAAEVKGKTAMVAATVAQKALNAAANANPYVLLASALIAVGTAIYKFTQKSNEAEKQQEEFNKKQEEARELNSKLANSIGSVIAEYNLLKREYTQINSLADKQQWIEENASAFEDLGLNINSVNDADKIFVEQSSKVIAALRARAKAEALTEKYKEAVIKAEEDKLNVKKVYPSKSYSFASNPAFKGPKEFEPYYTKTVVSTRPQMSGVWEQKTDAASQAAIERIVQQNYDDAIAAIDATVTYWEGVLEQAEEEALLAEAEIKGLVKTPSTKKSTTSGSSSTSSSSAVDVPEVYNEKSLKYAQQKVSELQDALSKMATDSPDFAPTLAQLREWEEKVEKIQGMMKKTPEGEPAKTLVEQYDEAVKKVNEIVKEYNIGIIDKETALKNIEEINQLLEKLGLNKIDVNLDTDDAEKKIITLEDAINSAFDGFNAIANVVSGVNSIYEAFKSLPEALKEAENGWERFMAGFDAAMSVMNLFANTMSFINTLMTAFNTIQELSTALKLKDAAATATKVSADTAAAGAAGAEAAANTAAATAGAAKSVAWLPIVGPILAVAAIAAVIGGIMAARSKGKYASGGIVPGASKIGDFNIAQVNGGEMILNTRQQANLFNMLDKNRLPHSSISSGEVTFRIQGDTLVGVIDNYNRKRSRI